VDDWLPAVIKSAGYLGIALLMIPENVSPAIPSELILPFAGFLVAKGDLNLLGVIASGSAGSTIGATAWYMLGRAWGVPACIGSSLVMVVGCCSMLTMSSGQKRGFASISGAPRFSEG